MNDIQLSKNFKLSELTYTHTEFWEENQTYALGFIKPLTELCQTILQPIRDHFGEIMTITSGIRCPNLNKKVGGVSNSQHVIGQAADFIIPGIELKDIWDWIKDSGLPYGQNILERGEWIHISLGKWYRPTEKCEQSFIVT